MKQSTIFIICFVLLTAISAQAQNVGIGEINPQGILHVSQPYNFPGIIFTGTGLNDLSINTVGYTGTGITNYAIRIQNAGPNPNMIEVSNNGGATWSSPQPIINPIVLINGITATFASANGHTYGARWDWVMAPSYYNTLVVKDGKVGIGTTNPTTSAQLDVSSTTKGFLPPRMTQTQRDAITSPVPGLMIWCTNCVAPTGELQIFNGTSWTNMIGGTTSSGTVNICTQAWAVKNLSVDRYRNGDPIPNVTDPTAWAALTTGAYCYYNNDSATYAATYGKLYNWYAVNDPRGLAPEGWHIPTDNEWTTIETCLGGASVAGGKMKETGTTHWLNPNTGATNSSGFTGLPGGYRNYYGTFFNVGSYGFWWSATESLTAAAWARYLYYLNGDISRGYVSKQDGFSVRCLRD